MHTNRVTSTYNRDNILKILNVITIGRSISQEIHHKYYFFYHMTQTLDLRGEGENH